MKILMISAVLVFCFLPIGYAVENREAMLSALRTVEAHYLSIFHLRKNNPDGLVSISTVRKYAREILETPEIEVWKPQKKVLLILEQAGVSVRQLCGSPNNHTNTMVLRLARVFNFAYSTWFRQRCIELHKTATLHNERRPNKLEPITIEKFLDLASKANKRSEFHQNLYLQYRTVMGLETTIYLLKQRKLPDYNYVDDEAENLKVLFKAATAILKSITEGWDVDRETGPIEIKMAERNLSRLRIKTHAHVSQIAELLEKWKGLITKERLELSMEYHFFLWMIHHLQYLTFPQLAHDPQDARLLHDANKVMKISNYHENLYKLNRKALQNYEEKTHIVEAHQSSGVTSNLASVEEGLPGTNDMDASNLHNDIYVKRGIGSDSDNGREFDWTLFLDLPGTEILHNEIDRDSVQQCKKQKFNTEKCFDGAHGLLTSERSNSESRKPVQLQ